MELVRLVYISKFKTKVNPSELAKIHKKALDFNPTHGITGVLIFGNDCFLQAIEGGRDAVNTLFSNISRDDRHEKIQLISYGEIDERDFAQWAMKLILIAGEKKEIFRFTDNSTFNPYLMNLKAASRLIHHYSNLSKNSQSQSVNRGIGTDPAPKKPVQSKNHEVD
jgi:hypothetical protein